MAGNIMYIPYTIFMIIGLIILIVVIIKLWKGNRVAKNLLIMSLPILILFQVYFWNIQFNDYVKSYLFPSKAFECIYEKQLKNISIPLPERTVFKGREDACSSFYSTFVNVNDFKFFYQEELEKLKDKGEIEKYTLIDRKDNNWSENMGYAVELSSGSIIDIFFKRREGSGMILIDFEPRGLL